MMKRTLFLAAIAVMFASCENMETSSSAFNSDGPVGANVSPKVKKAKGKGGCHLPTWLTVVSGGANTSLANGDAIVTNDSSQIIFAGAFTGSAILGDTIVTTTGNPVYSDVYVASLDNNGLPQWFRSFGSANNDWMYETVLDPDDDIYVTGSFALPLALGVTTLTTHGSVDAFFAKLDADTGDPIWAASGGGSLYDYPYAIAMTPDGDMVAHGAMSSGTSTFGSVSATSHGGYDAFTLSMNADEGSFSWAESQGGTGTDYGRRIATDEDGNLYVTGLFEGTAEFGDLDVVSAGGTDAYFARLSPTGVAEWVVRGGGLGADKGRAVAVHDDMVYFAGTFESSPEFADMTFEDETGPGMFLAAFSLDGALEWANVVPGIFGVNNMSVGKKSIYVGGYLEGTAVFGSSTITSAGSADAFIARFCFGGTAMSAIRFGGPGIDWVRGLQVEQSGDLIASGSFSGTAAFGDETRTAVGSSDAFAIGIPKQCF